MASTNTITGNFDTIDTSQIYSSTAYLIGQIGGNNSSSSSGFIDTQNTATKAIQQQISSYNVEAAKYAIDQAVQRDTDLLAQMNESWNANRYIYKAAENERGRLAHLDKMAKRDIQSAQQSYMMAQYGIRYHGFAVGVLMFTTFVTMLVLMPVALWRAGSLSSTGMFLIDGVLLLIYACVMILLFRDVAVRRSTNWDQYYWRASKTTSSGVGLDSQSDGGCGK